MILTLSQTHRRLGAAILLILGGLTPMTREAVAGPIALSPANQRLAALAKTAGLSFTATHRASAIAATGAKATTRNPAFCMRAGLGLTIPQLDTPLISMVRPVVGCETAPSPLHVSVIRGKLSQPPLPGSADGEYDLGLQMQYRLWQKRDMQLLAKGGVDAVGYGSESPLRGDSVQVGLTLQF